MYAPDVNERFVALSRAGFDDFYFTVASSSLLVLCDVRKPLMPILQWKHNIDEPCYMNVLSLSMLRSYSKVDTFKLASERGFCIILGSFWNSEFNLFCYGPAFPFRKGSITSKLSKISTTFRAWELPSEINLSSRECHCGICLFREELSKDALPEWIDWQLLKKEMVLGFGIISNDLASLLYEPDEHGGFTLVRIMSSGRFELQRYHASWSLDRKLEDCHEADLCMESHLLCPRSVEENKSVELHYLKLDYLCAYANGNLAQVLTTKLDKTYSNEQEEAPFCSEVHELLCKKLNACGLGHSRSSPAITSIFNDVKLPSNFHEVALRKLWTDLPLELLQLAFSSYSECREVNGFNQTMVPLEFLAVPDLPQLPPFFTRKPSPHDNNDIIGPVIPFPVLLVINEVRYGYSDLGSDGFSVEAELGLKYKEVIQAANEIAVSSHGSTRPDYHAVSLADEEEDPWADSSKPKPFLTYRPIALTFSDTDSVQGKGLCTDNIYKSFIFHVSEKSCKQTESVGAEIFDDLCPIEFLPQDVQLVEETEKAVGDPQLPEQHRALIDKSRALKHVELKNEETLNQLKEHNAELEKDVECVRQRDELLAKIGEMEANLKQHENLALQASLHFNNSKKEADECRQKLTEFLNYAKSIARLTPNLEKEFLEMPTTIEELEMNICFLCCIGKNWANSVIGIIGAALAVPVPALAPPPLIQGGGEQEQEPEQQELHR